MQLSVALLGLLGLLLGHSLAASNPAWRALKHMASYRFRNAEKPASPVPALHGAAAPIPATGKKPINTECPGDWEEALKCIEGCLRAGITHDGVTYKATSGLKGSGGAKMVFQGTMQTQGAAAVTIGLGVSKQTGHDGPAEHDFNSFMAAPEPVRQCPHILHMHRLIYNTHLKRSIIIMDFIPGQDMSKMASNVKARIAAAPKGTAYTLKDWRNIVIEMLTAWDCMLTKGYAQEDKDERNMMVTNGPPRGYMMIDISWSEGPNAFNFKWVLRTALQLAGLTRKCFGTMAFNALPAHECSIPGATALQNAAILDAFKEAGNPATYVAADRPLNRVLSSPFFKDPLVVAEGLPTMRPFSLI